MSKYLIRTVETYRCDTEAEAEQLISEAKKATEYEVKKTSSEVRFTKQKGEIVDEWKRVTITKEFTEEKEPEGILMPIYEIPNKKHNHLEQEEYEYETED